MLRHLLGALSACIEAFAVAATQLPARKYGPGNPCRGGGGGSWLIYARQAGGALAREQKKLRKSRQSSLGGN
jgi:hypothetical protein